ncbi:protein toll-like [Pollicipes pollicipes]|uniref:protein toll-like n=1 Tax=Pollicipes pollicipes TaxID=41117 RepID=UPI0018855B34|nr:protein toll-like [Pollicipes pollicipes]
MLRRWLAATLAPLAVALAAAADPRLHCQRTTPSSASIGVLCLHEQEYRLRLSYTNASAGADSRLLIWCNPLLARAEDYEALFDLDLRLGDVSNVVLSLCPLPAGRLRDFFRRLGLTGVELVKVQSHDVLNDTMPADFMDGVDVVTLHLDSLTRIELHDDFFGSVGDLHNLTITGTNVSLPEGLFRPTPRLRRLGVWNLNAGRLPTALLHGLHNLTRLSVGRNSLRTLSRAHFRDLARLRHLDLYKNQLETLPADVFAPLPSLEVLRMECNALRSLPESLFQSTPRLKLLRVNGHVVVGNLSTLPAGIFRGLDQLELLMIDRLGLQQLPDGLFSGLVSLKNLTIDHNQVSDLPDNTFAGLRNLRNLDLSSNRLRTLPAGLLRDLVSLDTLYLHDNGLASFPAEMFAHTPALGRLFMQDNDLTSLGRGSFVGLAKSLTLLDLSNNSLWMDAYEPAFAEIGQIQELRLQHNKIDQIPYEILLNLLKLKRLDLRHNLLDILQIADFNFVCRDADIYMQHNNVSTIYMSLTAPLQNPSAQNRIHLADNPFVCDCNAVTLKQFLERSGPFADTEPTDNSFQLATDDLRCARPAPLAGRRFSSVSADHLLCAYEVGCTPGCSCVVHPSDSTVVVSCPQVPAGPLPELDDLPASFGLTLRVEGAQIRRLNMTLATAPPSSNETRPPTPLFNIQLNHNAISELTPDLLPPGLLRLSVQYNNISHIGKHFLELLDAAENNETQVWLGHNPYACDCALIPLHQYLQLHVSRDTLRIVDADQMTCAGQNRSLLEMQPTDLCPSHTATIVAVCVVAFVIAIFLLLFSIVYHRHGEMIKVWLYAHNLCLWLVTEEELDADKKYDAFVSYSHLDEEFVVEQLVPQLEQGEPKYSLCLHFRDWLAGEWITDQIQQSVQDSRRVIVVMSQNFIRSEWGRLEFLTAHKQALNDKRNRVIVVVYGELPDPAGMDPELRLYISMNTYLKWGDALFWERLRYALPHKGRRLKAARRRQRSEKLGLIGRENGAGPTVSNGELGGKLDDHVV